MPERTGHGTRSGHVRDPTDYYATTPDLARLTCEAIRDEFAPNPKTILDPGCGTGNYLQAVRETWPDAEVVGIEIHDDLATYSTERGFNVHLRDLLQNELGLFDLIIGNPPFKHANLLVPILCRSLTPKGTLALVLRLNFKAGQDRYDKVFKTFPIMHHWTLPARPGFTADGKTDGTDYGFFVWQDGFVGRGTHDWLDNRGIQNKWAGTVKSPDPVFPDPRPQAANRAIYTTESGTKVEHRPDGQWRVAT